MLSLLFSEMRLYCRQVKKGRRALRGLDRSCSEMRALRRRALRRRAARRAVPRPAGEKR